MTSQRGWPAVIAAAIGALLASLDISIVNASLPNIGGELGVSRSATGWISTAYLSAEAVSIPITVSAQRVFGLRIVLISATAIFGVSSIACGLSEFREFCTLRLS